MSKIKIGSFLGLGQSGGVFSIKTMENEVMPPPPKIPWQLIAFSFQGMLDTEGLRQLAEWVCASRANQDQYEEWHRLWQQMVAKEEL